MRLNEAIETLENAGYIVEGLFNKLFKYEAKIKRESGKIQSIYGEFEGPRFYNSMFNSKEDVVLKVKNDLRKRLINYYFEHSGERIEIVKLDIFD